MEPLQKQTSLPEVGATPPQVDEPPARPTEPNPMPIKGISNHPGERPRRRAVRWVALLLILGLLAFLLLPKLGLIGGDETTGKAGATAGGPGGKGGPPPPTRVTAFIVTAGTGSTPVSLAGTVLPNEQVDVSSEVSGKVTSINFSEGAYVGRGEVLARLNDSELRASLTRAQSRLKLAELNQQRKEALLAREAVSPAEYEIAVNELEVARADIALLRAQIEKTVIRAPFSGRIGLRRISLGSYVTPTTVIATLQDLDPLKIEFAIPESYAPRVNNGMTFFYSIDGSSIRRSARVYAIEPGLDVSSRTLKVRALSPNRDNDIMPGQYASVEMPTGGGASRPVVPTQAVIPTIDGQQVFVVRDGKAATQKVETGTRSKEYVEIVSGVTAGDTVIVEGIQTINEGSPVIPMVQ